MTKVYKNEKFNVDLFKINFYKKIEKEDITNLLLLQHMMFNSNKLFPGKRLFNKEKIVNDIIDCYSDLSFDTDNLFLTLTIKHTSSDFKKIEIFLNNLLYNINFEDQLVFDYGVNLIKERINSIKENPSTYGMMKIFEEMVPNSNYSLRQIGYLEDLEKITPSTLKDYYDRLLNEASFETFAVTNDDVNLKPKKNIEIIKDKKHNFEFNKEVKYVEEIFDKKQSKVFIGYKIENLTPYEIEILVPLWNVIFGGGADGKLFKEIREKNSLCYSISSKYYRFKNMIVVGSGLDKDNFKKAIDLIDIEFTKMKNEISEEELDIAKKAMIKNIKDTYDSIDSYLSSKMLSESFYFYDEEEKLSLIDKVKIEDLYNLFNKIKKDTILHLKGDSNDQK